MPTRGVGRRWCETCEHEVHDLSALSESEARALLRAKVGESICAAYRVDSRGELAFRDRAPRGWMLAAALASGCLRVDSPELELPDEPAACDPASESNLSTSSGGVGVDADTHFDAKRLPAGANVPDFSVVVGGMVVTEDEPEPEGPPAK